MKKETAIKGVEKLLKKVEKDLKYSFKLFGYFDKYDYAAATVDLFHDYIYLNFSRIDNFEELAGTFFHEYAHIQNKYTGKYQAFHQLYYNMDRKRFKLMKKTFIKAEIYTDKIAAKLLKDFYPNFKYDFPYSKRENIKYMQKIIKTMSYTNQKKFLQELFINPKVLLG